MSKFRCVCGHVIPDQSDNLPYKGSIIRDKHHDDLYAAIDEMAAYLAAERDGNGQEWLITRFRKVYDHHQQSPANVIFSLWSDFYYSRYLCIYQCENCGRIWIEGERGGHLYSFLPDEPDSHGVLDVK